MGTRYTINSLKHLSDEEVTHLEAILESIRDTHPRDAAIFWTLLYTGARVGELLEVDCRDLNDGEKTIFVRGLKGSDDRELPLPNWLYTMLADQRARVKQGRLFPLSYSRVLDRWNYYSPVRKKIHALRHTFALRLYKATNDVRLVQVALGHRSIENTMVYVTYVHNVNEIRKSVRKVWARKK